MRCNAELLGKYGNLVNRVLVFALQQCEARVPTPGDFQAVDSEFIEKIGSIAEEASKAYEHFHLRRASQAIMELAQVSNAYFDMKKPWQAAKQPEKASEMRTTIYCCVQAIKVLALLAAPILPTSSQKIWEMLGFADPLTEQNWDDVLKMNIDPGTILPKPVILFAKVEDEQIQKELDSMKALSESVKKENPTFPPLKPEIAFEDVKKLDLRVAKILQVERVPKSKKLLKLLIDIGFEKRTVVSGIGENMPDIQLLVGKQIILVANLKPALLMGIESQGMILSAEHDKVIELPVFSISPSGASVS
jgi:methionyl-tRNA synthetase